MMRRDLMGKSVTRVSRLFLQTNVRLPPRMVIHLFLVIHQLELGLEKIYLMECVVLLRKS